MAVGEDLGGGDEAVGFGGGGACGEAASGGCCHCLRRNEK